MVLDYRILCKSRFDERYFTAVRPFYIPHYFINYCLKDNHYAHRYSLKMRISRMSL